MPEAKTITTTAPAEKKEPPKPAGPLDEKFAGRRRFFAGIQVTDGLVPVHSISIAGTVFQVFTQTPTTNDSSARGRAAPKSDGEAWLTLSDGEAGDFLELTHLQLTSILKNVPFYWVRWHKGRDAESGEMEVRRADVYNLTEGTLTADPASPGNYKKVGYRWNVEEGDEPMARHLVLLPAENLHEYGSRMEIDNLPSLETLYPELGKEPMRE